MNKVLLVGRIANEISYNKTNNGISYARASVAVSRRGVQDQTDFVPLIAWRTTADLMNNMMTKGALVSVEGSIITGSYQNNDGKVVRTVEVQIDRFMLLESRNTIQNRNSNQYDNKNNQYQQSNNNYSSNKENYSNYSDFKNNSDLKQTPTFGVDNNKSSDFNLKTDEDNTTSWEYDMSNIDTLD